MTAPDDMNDMQSLAGEYVLGTLDADERADVARRRMVEADLDAAIEAWEREFAPLLDDVAGVPPSDAVFAAITRKLGGSPAVDGPAVDPASPTLTIAPNEDPRRGAGATPPGDNVIKLKRRVAVWRGAAIAASLALVGLVGVLTYRPALLGKLQPTDQRFVAVFQDDDVAPRFVMSVDLDTRQVTIRPIRAEALADQSYQLWVVSDTLPPGPQSLGLLEGADQPTRKVIDNLTPAALQDALFGISVEPVGGSPTGKPTGVALHGTLIPTDTDQAK